MSALSMPSQEQVMDFLHKCKDAAYANYVTLEKAGLFKFENIKVYSAELATPFTLFWENQSVAYVQSILLAQTMDLNKGFICMNAVAFFLEVLGSLAALLLGRSLPLFFFEIIYAYLVAYILYWLVVLAVPASSVGNDYQLVAIGLYVVYSIINTIQGVTTLGLILPPLFFFSKTIATLSCAYYVFKIEKGSSGATMLKETPGQDLELSEKVAE